MFSVGKPASRMQSSARSTCAVRCAPDDTDHRLDEALHPDADPIRTVVPERAQPLGVRGGGGGLDCDGDSMGLDPEDALSELEEAVGLARGEIRRGAPADRYPCESDGAERGTNGDRLPLQRVEARGRELVAGVDGREQVAEPAAHLAERYAHGAGGSRTRRRTR